MKLKFAVFTLILAIAPPLIAQKLTSDSLVITGSIEKVDAYYEDKCTVRMLVYLQFRNDGNVPLIFFNPSRFLIKRVRFANNETGDPTERVVSVDSFVQGMRARDFSESAYYAETIKSINRPEPPRTIVQPGFTYEFTDELIVDSGFQCEKSNGEAPRSSNATAPVSIF